MENSKNIRSDADDEKQNPSSEESSQSSNLQNKHSDESVRDSSYNTEPKAGESSGAEITPSSLSAKPGAYDAAASTSNVSYSFEHNSVNQNSAKNLSTLKGDANKPSASSSNSTSTNIRVQSRLEIDDALRLAYTFMKENSSSNNKNTFISLQRTLQDSRASMQAAPGTMFRYCPTNLSGTSNQASNSVLEGGNFSSSENFVSPSQDSCWTDNRVQELLEGLNENSSRHDINQVAVSLLKRVAETLANIYNLLDNMNEPSAQWLFKNRSVARARDDRKNESTLNNWPDIKFRLERLNFWLNRIVGFAVHSNLTASVFCVRDMISIVVENDRLMDVSNVFDITLIPGYLGDNALDDFKEQLALIITKLLSIASDIKRLREIADFLCF